MHALSACLTPLVPDRTLCAAELHRAPAPTSPGLVSPLHHRSMPSCRAHRAGAYIVVMYAYFLLQYALFIAVMVVSGVVARLPFFRRNGAGVQIVSYFLYGNVQVAFAFLLSCAFSRTRTANICSWIWILGAGIFAEVFMYNMIVQARWYAWLLQLIPTFGAYRCVPPLRAYPVLRTALPACMDFAGGAGALLQVLETAARDAGGFGSWASFRRRRRTTTTTA